MTATDPLAELMSEGAPTISFKDESMRGTWVVGIVKKVEKSQQHDFMTKEPKFFDDQKQRPMWQYVVTIQTDERVGEDDDGMRRLFCKGQMIGALKNALAKANVMTTAAALNGKLGIVWYGEGEPSRAGMNPPKLYKAKFEPADATTDLANEPDEPDDDEPSKTPPPADDFDDSPF